MPITTRPHPNPQRYPQKNRESEHVSVPWLQFWHSLPELTRLEWRGIQLLAFDTHMRRLHGVHQVKVSKSIKCARTACQPLAGVNCSQS